MYFKQILDERLGCASYLIASRESHEAAIVDPSLETDVYEDLLAARDFTLRYVIDTHVHADHVSGARRLADRHGAELCLHEAARVTYPFHPLHDGDVLPLGQLRLQVLHTPGHRPELISLLIINPPRSPEPSMVLTGDSLLVGDVGRPTSVAATRVLRRRVSGAFSPCPTTLPCSRATSRDRAGAACAAGPAAPSASSAASIPCCSSRPRRS